MIFDKYATRGAYHYDWYKTEPWYKACVDRCVDFCKGSTLDVGCGDGLVTVKLREAGNEVCGIDNDRIAIELAKDKDEYGWGLDFELADINSPIKGKWEYMVCLNVIEHLEDPNVIKRIFNRNITKAAIIITDMPQKQPSKYHVKEYSPYELKQLFHTRKVVGFQIDDNFHGVEIYKV